MLAPPAAVVAEREAARRELAAEVPGYGWGALGKAERDIYPTSVLSPMALNLAPFEAAAASQLGEQPPKAASLGEVLNELEIRAGEPTVSNAFTQGFALGDRLQRDVVLIDRAGLFIVLHYDPSSRGLNYLLRPASFLEFETKPGDDPTSEADLAALLRLIIEQQDYNHVVRRSDVVAAFMVRDDQVVLHESFKIHPELFPERKPGEPAPPDCTLATYRRVNGSSIAPGGEPATDSQLSKPEVSALRHTLVHDVTRRHVAARGSKHFWLEAQIDHSIPCWLVTYLLMQFFGPKNLGDLSPADRLWLYEVVKSLHNGSTNAMMVSEVRNQYHIWLSVLLAMGLSMDDISSESRRSGQQCVERWRKHSHTSEWIDFSPSFARLPLAVDAATMLEAFHGYGHELHRIGKRQLPDSQRRKAAFVMAAWFFDAGDRARLPGPP
jgi:hypothetical protein